MRSRFIIVWFGLLGLAANANRTVAADALAFIEADHSAGSSVAVMVDEKTWLAHTAQFFPVDPQRRAMFTKNEMAELAKRGGPLLDSVAEQAKLVLGYIDLALLPVETRLSQTVKLNVYLATIQAMPKVREVLAKSFPGASKPAVSFVVGDLPIPGVQIAMDAVSATGTADMSMGHRAGLPDLHGIKPVAVLRGGSKIYVSGMADTNNLPIATRKTLEKLLAAIGHLGLDKQDIVQLKAFMQPISEVEVVREEIVRFFNSNAPPTVFIEWISPPPNPPIEIELIAAGKGDFSKEPESVSFLTPPGTTDSKVFRRVARINHGKLIYTSGLYGMKASDGTGQLREIFGSLGDILKKTGSDFDHLAKATYYMTDNESSNALNDIRPEFYNPLRAPSASKAKVKGVGIADKTVAMDMIAVTK